MPPGGRRWRSVFAGLGVAGLFVLGHDASHGALFDSPTVNKQVARWCMLPSLHNEAAWDLGHNRIHHGYTTRIGFDFVWHPATAEEYAAMSRLHRLRHRVEWSCIGAGAYYLRAVWWDKMMTLPPGGQAGRWPTAATTGSCISSSASSWPPSPRSAPSRAASPGRCGWCSRCWWCRSSSSAR